MRVEERRGGGTEGREGRGQGWRGKKERKNIEPEKLECRGEVEKA